MADEQYEQNSEQNNLSGRSRRPWIITADIALLVIGLSSAGLSLRGTPAESIFDAPNSLLQKTKKGYLVERMIIDVPRAIINLEPKIATKKLPDFSSSGKDMKNLGRNAYELLPSNADTIFNPLTSYLAMFLSYLPFRLLRKYVTRPIIYGRALFRGE